MKRENKSGVSRRQFLQAAGVAAGTAAVGGLSGHALAAAGRPAASAPAAGGVKLVLAANDPIASSAPAQWAMGKLIEALTAKGIATADENPALTIYIAGSNATLSQRILNQAKVAALTAPESLVLLGRNDGGPRILLAAGADGNGLSYALMELADRINNSDRPLAALQIDTPIIEKPSNKVRSISRAFVSEEEDKPWFYDLDGWKRYFDMLATNRFNKFNLCLGLAYDFSDRVVDGYFYYAYPFFLKVPGATIRVLDRKGNALPDEEIAKNLATLQFISKEAVARGIHFQLGLWTHSIKWPLQAGVIANYTLDGITSAQQASYSHDALRALLLACPDIKGLTIRTHGESGVSEAQSNDLWKAVFEATKNLPDGRKVEIDLHAKGITFEIIDAARATENPVIVTPKYWAEHNGLPYMQSSIREWELPKADTGGLMSRSTGTRNHMRYGFGDILIQNRQYGVVHRVFPGTQRFLLWGDPLFAREYGKMFSFNGTDGVEFFEPLAFKGRQGTGMAKNRSAYSDAALAPKWSDQMDKYEYTFRLWGRLTYNPDADADVWQRLLRRDYGPAAQQLEGALSSASRILPMVTVAHSPSAAQANFWPEVYSNMSHHDATNPTFADDTPSPKVFGTVTALDPQLFASVNESADALIVNKPLGKITVAQVATQLDTWASITARNLAALVRNPTLTIPVRRAMVDARLAGTMGTFWAAKFMTGLYYAIFEKTGHEPARVAALASYQKARDAMAEAAAFASNVYITDVTFGSDPKIRGQWADRLAHIDRDMAGMKTVAAKATNDAAGAAALTRVNALPILYKFGHTAADTFQPGTPLPIRLKVDVALDNVKLWYRHVNQAEKYKSIDMTRAPGEFNATIPADYTKSPYALQYYFEITVGNQAILNPGFQEDYTGMPYYFVPQQAPAGPEKLP